jgi:hypothetical protein
MTAPASLTIRRAVPADLARVVGRAEGAVRLTLSTELANAPAQALYEAAGWRRDEGFCVYHLLIPNQNAQ